MGAQAVIAAKDIRSEAVDRSFADVSFTCPDVDQHAQWLEDELNEVVEQFVERFKKKVSDELWTTVDKIKEDGTYKLRSALIRAHVRIIELENTVEKLRAEARERENYRFVPVYPADLEALA